MEISLWREMLLPYSLAVDELVTKFEHIKKAQNELGLYSPIYSVSGRVKSIASILDKTMKKHIPLDRIEENIFDLAGVRVICQFLDDCMAVVEYVRNRTDMEIVEEEDYISNPKPSGYRSYHLKVKYQVQLLDGPKDIFAEIQIRTMGMNCWSTIEHSLQYKYKGNMPEVLKVSLNEAAARMLDSEKELSTVRDEIMEAQATKEEQNTLVSDILITIINIFQSVSRREALRIQDEFLEIYRQDDYEKLKHFAKELDVIAEGYGVQSYGN
jgi:putative GTP pyrophosphokinase